ncbi:hypothetical protein MAR_027479 [Mya arenaria]|uniref:Uncharacterized protein n=1 Tax=Mya arenaria TaxID=6604 RepID=A0ABY7EWH0_MYAAR|nr:hypothetical protein MAR_027479 [Mya arenaria]
MALAAYSPRTPRLQHGAGDHRLLMYRFSKHRSKSCGAVTRATRVRGPSDTVGNEERAAGISSRDTKGYTQQRSTGRRAVFGDSVLVVTNAGEERRAEVRGHVTTGGDRKSTDIELDVARNGVELSWRNMVGPQANSGFARLDMLS